MKALRNVKKGLVLIVEIFLTLVISLYSLGELLNAQINIKYEVTYVSDDYWLSTINNSILIVVYSVVVLICCASNYSKLPHIEESNDKHESLTTPKSSSKCLLVLLILFSIMIVTMDCIVMYNCINIKMGCMNHVDIGKLEWFCSFKSIVLGYLCLCLFVRIYTAFSK